MGKNEVQYRTETVLGRNKLLRMTPLEFMRRVAFLIPPPNKNLVHYYGALAPNSPLHPAAYDSCVSIDNLTT